VALATTEEEVLPAGITLTSVSENKKTDGNGHPLMLIFSPGAIVAYAIALRETSIASLMVESDFGRHDFDSSVLQHMFGVDLKWTALMALAMHNCVQMIVMHQSRVQTGPKYITSTAVVMQEFGKIIFSLIMLRIEQKDWAGTVRALRVTLFGDWRQSVPILIPALIYTLQNNLLLVAMSYLDAVTCQVTYQLKIFTTALFARIMLRQEFTRQQWLSFVLLAAGVSIVVNQTSSAQDTVRQSSTLIGVIAVVSACILSGFAGIFLEKTLKAGHASIWVCDLLCLDLQEPYYLCT
jgi:hypothetical protein